MDFHYNRWHLFCQSVFLFLSLLFIKKTAVSPSRETAVSIVGTMGAEGKHAESHRRERPMCRSAAWQIQSVWTKRNHPRHVIPSERSESRNLPKLHVLPCVGTFLPRSGFLHSADATVGMTMMLRFYGFAHCFQNVSGRTAPHPPPAGGPPSPLGKVLRASLGRFDKTDTRKHGTKASPPGKLAGRSPD